MNGFVVNLLSRSRGTADIVRPRLASLFEPGEARASPAEGQLPSELDAEETLSIDGRASTPAPPHQELASFRSSHALRVERAIEGRDVPGRVAARLLDSQNQRSGIAAQAGKHTAVPLNGTDVASYEESGRMAGPDGAAGPVVPAPGSPGPQRNGVTPPRGPTSARAADAADFAALGDERGLRGRFDTFHTTESPRLAVPATDAAHPALVPAPTPRFRFEPPTSRARVPDPIVEISIGRIEVRTVVERSVDRKASTASAVMGLDEYLEARVRRSAR
jgi:hypothetical protein